MPAVLLISGLVALAFPIRVAKYTRWETRPGQRALSGWPLGVRDPYLSPLQTQILPRTTIE